MLVAPPAHGLDARDHAQDAVIPGHLADACVLRFDGVVGGRHGYAYAQFGIHERGYGPFPYATAHDVARLDEALVQAVLTAVGPCALLLEEVLVPHLPVGAQPDSHGVAVLDTREFLGQAQQLPGRFMARVRAEYGADVETDVEQAALHAGVRPCVPEGLANAAAPAAHAAHGHHGFGDADHQVHPCGAGLAPGHVPAEHMPVPVSDEHDRIAAQVDAVEVHHVVDLSVHRARRPQAPAKLVAPAQRARTHAAPLLRVGGEQPVEEGAHVVRLPVIGAAAAGAAARVFAQSTGPARAGFAVLLHLPAAPRAPWRLHATMEPALSNACQPIRQ